MLKTSQIRFMVFIVALSYIADSSLSYSSGSEFRCKWDCSAHKTDLAALRRKMKTSMTTNKWIKLNVQYEKIVDDKCANETSVNSSEYASEYCQVCLVNRKLFPSTTAIESLISSLHGLKDIKIRAICNLNPEPTTASNTRSNTGRSFAICHLINFEAELSSTGYQAVEKYDLRSCMNATTSDGTNSTIVTLEQRVWPSTVLICFSSVFIAVFMYYSLAFLCLFYPTEILQDGVPYINLEGASPVSLRSFAGNYFFSRSGGIWQKTKTFLLRVLIIPLPFLFCAAFFVYKTDSFLDMPASLQRSLILYSFCYCFQAFYISFYLKRSTKAKPCFVCKLVKPTILSCQDVLPRLIINHLRLQPLIFVECWRFFKRCFVNYVKTSILVIPSFRAFIISVLRLALFITLLLFIPILIIVLVVVVCLLALIGVIMTSPVVALYSAQYRPSDTTSEISILLFVLIHKILSLSTITGAVILLFLAACGTLLALLHIFVLSFSEEHLPYVACFVFVVYYVWSSYSSFTKIYHELALALFYYNKNSRQNQVKNLPHDNDQLQTFPNTEDNTMAIPKGLFDMACEELMPLREGVCILILKITVLVSSAVIVFTLALMFSFETTPLMKTLLTFLTLSFPKIVAIYVDGGWQKKLRAMVVEEKVPKIVEKYSSQTYETNCRQRSRNAKIDEVILVNEDHIELVNMKS